MAKDPALPQTLVAILKDILRRLEALERRKVGGGSGG